MGCGSGDVTDSFGGGGCLCLPPSLSPPYLLPSHPGVLLSPPLHASWLQCLPLHFSVSLYLPLYLLPFFRFVIVAASAAFCPCKVIPEPPAPAAKAQRGLGGLSNILRDVELLLLLSPLPLTDLLPPQTARIPATVAETVAASSKTEIPKGPPPPLCIISHGSAGSGEPAPCGFAVSLPLVFSLSFEECFRSFLANAGQERSPPVSSCCLCSCDLRPIPWSCPFAAAAAV